MNTDQIDLRVHLANDLQRGFESLVATYQHQLYSFLLRRLGNPQEAEDLAQETFLQAYYSLKRYPPERIQALALRAWLYKIASNVQVNVLKRPAPPSVPLEMVETGALVKRFFPDVSSISTVNQVTWSPDGRYLAGGFNSSGGTNGIAIWDVSTGELVKTLSANVEEMAWSPNGKYLAITGGQPNTQVVIWSTSNWSQIQNLDIEATPLAWSPNSTQLAIGTDSGEIEILEASTGKTVLTYDGQDQLGAMTLAWSPDGKRIASANIQSTQIWSATSGLQLFTYPGNPDNALGVDLAWSPDGQYIASTFPNQNDGGTVKVWQAA